MQYGTYGKYIIKLKNENIIKLAYKKEFGLYYQKLDRDEWSHEIIIYKNSFKNFCVVQNRDGEVYTFCQNICGDVISLKFEDEEWKIKSTIHIGQHVIMPVNIKAFLCNNDIHLLYSIVDEYNVSETLVEKVALNCKKWTQAVALIKFRPKFQMFFYVFQDPNSNIFLINFDFNKKYRIVSKYFNANYNNWGDKEIIDESEFPYVDCDLVVRENIRHYIYIIREEKVSKVIYLYKNGGVKIRTTLFFDKHIQSCLIKFCDTVLWTLWMCDNKLYGSFSTDNGKEFSNPKVYVDSKNIFLEDIFYKEYIESEKNISVPCKFYIENIKNKSLLFLNGFLKKLTFNISNEFAIENKLGVTVDSFDELYKSIEYEKEEISNIKYRLNMEKKRNKELEEKCTRLKDQVDYLRNKLKLENMEKLKLKHKFDELENQNAKLEKQAATQSVEKNNEEKIKKSFKKWFWGS